MSAKPFRRKDLKHDEFITATGKATRWLMQRRRRIAWGLIAVAAVLFVVLSLNIYHQREEARAAALLTAAMEVYRAAVVPPVPADTEPAAEPATGAPGANGGDEEGGGGPEAVQNVATSGTGETEPSAATEPSTATDLSTTTAPSTATEPSTETEPALAPTARSDVLQFSSEQEKFDAARARFAPIVRRFPSRPSGRVAAFYLGICEAELGNDDAAAEAFGQAAEASQPLIAAMALYRLGQLRLDSGAPDEAVTYFERLLQRGSDVFPGEEALMAKARAHEEAGDPRAALAAYQRVVNDFAGSFSAIDARGRVEEISAQLGLDPDVEGL